MGLRVRRPPGSADIPLEDPLIPAPRTLADIVCRDHSNRSAALTRRITTLLSALRSPPANSTADDLLADLDSALHDPQPEEVWLALSVLTGQLPDVAEVQRTIRAIRLDGPLPALFAALAEIRQVSGSAGPEVEIISGGVTVDVHHTAQNLFNTGIQRVVRETARRWTRFPNVMLVAWDHGFGHFRPLSPAEADCVIPGASLDPTAARPSAGDRVLVPWKCTHLVAELTLEPGRTRRYQAFARFSGSTTGFIGFDCVPVFAGETVHGDTSLYFANYLAAVAHVDRIATISSAAELEFRGWCSMLSGAGLPGPDICCIPLPVQAETPTDAAMGQAHNLLAIGTLPIVLAVGSHEPRKNHLAVLHAAELLWREGLLFTLVFVGGNSWSSAPFEAQLDALRSTGRPVQVIRALPDDLLWAAYRQAYCTVFASLHEGYGLPVAESLASGTPVITSNFGSMRDLARHGGALLIDPRQDHQLTDALRQLLLDRPLRDSLAAEAAAIPLRSWDDYANDTWNYLVTGMTPAP
jgi:glycosyltransferase involved in cell wall biosynthesis